MNKIGSSFILILVAAFPTLSIAASPQLAVKAVNKLPLARPGQTVELSASELALLVGADLQKIHVKDAAGKELLCQAVDTDFDSRHKPDSVIFQADFAPEETKSFTAYSGTKHVYTKSQFRAHGRFVRERFDDFAWENDKIAHRMYGKGLETWVGEPLTSSTVDIWSKRVPDMVIDDWYLVDNYHSDSGQGADFYSAGPSRGCGGNGLWADGKLWVSKNFVDSRVLANGPIRVMFELVYEPFDVNGTKVSEVKRITLDAGSQFDRFQSFYRPQAAAGPLTCAIGIKKVEGARKQFNVEHGWLAIWEKVEKSQGMQGVAVVVDPKTLEKQAEDRLNDLLLVKVGPDNVITYMAGFAWDKAGLFTTQDVWNACVDQAAQGLQSPIVVTVQAKD